MANEKMIKEWFRFAVRDLRAGMALADFGTQFKNAMAFNAQQCAEKALKAFILSKNERPPKTHDIESLAELVEKWDKALGKLGRNAKILTEYAVVYRYPDAEKKPMTLGQAKAAIKKARLIYDRAYLLVYGSEAKIKGPRRK